MEVAINSDGAPGSWSAQPSTFTLPGRNDRSFQRIAKLLGEAGIASPRLLSFGCSTGVEAIDLKRIFPRASVFGCDVNAEALLAAREAASWAGLTIFDSSHGTLAEHGPFDAVVAMNVLVRWPATFGLDEIADIYPFEDFDKIITSIFDALKVGGYMAIYNSCYLVEQASVAQQLRPISQPTPVHNGWVDKYERSGRRVAVACNNKGVPLLKQDWTKYRNNNSVVGPTDNTRFILSDDSGDGGPDLSTIIWQRVS